MAAKFKGRADSFLYADDVKLIAPRNCHDILQNSLNISASWSKDWELGLKSEHLPICNSLPHVVSYTLPPHNPPNTRQSQIFSLLKTWELS